MEYNESHNGHDSDSSSDFNLDQGLEFETHRNDIIIDDVQSNEEFNVPAMLTETSDQSEQTFDPTLPMQHSYLGSDLTVLHGRTFLDDDAGSSYWVPLLPQPDVVLVPGQTLPLSVLHPPTIQMIHRALESNRIFGTVCVTRSDPFSGATFADVGTTAEIYEVLEDGSNDSMRIKAIGRQRFKLLERKQDSEGFPRARVQILPEIILPHPMAGISFEILDRYRIQGKDKGKAAKKMQHLRSKDSVLSVWPTWVYTQYDSEELVKKMLGVLSCHNAVSQIPNDPVELSFWVARSLPIKDSTRLILLRMNCAVQRLRWELYTLTKISILCCRHCNQVVAHQQDVFSMSAEGLQGAYCNLYGYVYETITIYKTKGLQLQNVPPSTEFSWFPGYAWTVASCNLCMKHMGWQFTATNSGIKPKVFWGLCRRSLTAKIEEE